MGQIMRVIFTYFDSSLKLPPPFLKFGIIALNKVIRKLTIELSFSVGVNRVTRSANPSRPNSREPQLLLKKVPVATGSTSPTVVSMLELTEAEMVVSGRLAEITSASC